MLFNLVNEGVERKTLVKFNKLNIYIVALFWIIFDDSHFFVGRKKIEIKKNEYNQTE